MGYRAGIIGTGGIAGMGILGMHDTEIIGKEKVRASHAGGYDAAADIDLVAVADIDEEKLRALRWSLSSLGTSNHSMSGWRTGPPIPRAPTRRRPTRR
jgi:predicted dehydrogenase